MSYRAPVRDIRFALEEVAALDSVNATGAFPEFSSDLTPAILDEAAKLANDVLAPLNWSGDQQGCTLKDGVVTTPDGFKDAYAQFVEGGWQADKKLATWFVSSLFANWLLYCCFFAWSLCWICLPSF